MHPGLGRSDPDARVLQGLPKSYRPVSGRQRARRPARCRIFRRSDERRSQLTPILVDRTEDLAAPRIDQWHHRAVRLDAGGKRGEREDGMQRKAHRTKAAMTYGV